jgi:hypothetical protein
LSSTIKKLLGQSEGADTVKAFAVGHVYPEAIELQAPSLTHQKLEKK